MYNWYQNKLNLIWLLSSLHSRRWFYVINLAWSAQVGKWSQVFNPNSYVVTIIILTTNGISVIYWICGESNHLSPPVNISSARLGPDYMNGLVIAFTQLCLCSISNFYFFKKRGRGLYPRNQKWLRLYCVLAILASRISVTICYLSL